jgi:hypothetical protein
MKILYDFSVRRFTASKVFYSKERAGDRAEIEGRLDGGLDVNTGFPVRIDR